jgi:hypothetical protein
MDVIDGMNTNDVIWVKPMMHYNAIAAIISNAGMTQK